MALTRESKRYTVLPLKTNMTARAITDSVWVASDAFGVGDYAQLTVEIQHSNSSATDVQFYLQHTTDGTNLTNEQSISISSGTGTLSSLVHVKAVTTDTNWFVQIPITMPGNHRLQFTGTSADGTDNVTVFCHLAM